MSKTRCVVCDSAIDSDVPVCRACVAVVTPARLAYLMTERGRPAIRTCLRCGQGFLSSHAGNRICDECRRVAVVWWTGWGGGAGDDEG